MGGGGGGASKKQASKSKGCDVIMEVKGRKSIAQKGQSTTSEAAERSRKTEDCRRL